ncbi:MAG: ArnT family glycosyltransferase [Acetatifactor sp.]
MIGIGWGMPRGDMHPDEGIIFGQAYQCALNRNFEVHEYYRPNHVTIKLNTLVYVGIQEFYFAPQGLDDFALNYSEHFALFTVASRIVTAVFSLGIVVFAYLIALYWGRNQALFAALLFAVFPSFLEHSHYITPDIPLLFFLMGVLWSAFRYLKKPSMTWLFWMSFFTALATCEKYPGAYGCAIIAAAVCVTHIRRPMRIVRDGLLAILFFVLGILAVSPILIIDLNKVLEQMTGQNRQYHLGADGLNFPQTVLFYLGTAAVHMGLLLTVSSVYGVVRSFMKKGKQTFLLFTFFAYIVPISTLRIHWERYTLPIYAIGLLFGAIGVFYILEDLYKVIGKKVLASLGVGFFLFLLPTGSLLASAMAVDGSFLAPDSRILLQEVCEELNVTTNNTVFDSNTPLDPGGFYGAFSNFEAADPEQYKYGSRPRFVMTSSAQRDLFLESDPEVYGWIANFYRKLDENYPLVLLYPVETPSFHFIELQNIWCAAKTVHRYMKGAAVGYEIRLYQLLP